MPENRICHIHLGAMQPGLSKQLVQTSSDSKKTIAFTRTARSLEFARSERCVRNPAFITCLRRLHLLKAPRWVCRMVRHTERSSNAAAERPEKAYLCTELPAASASRACSLLAQQG